MPHVVWRGPVLCASPHASGARDALAGLDAAGCGIEVQQTPWARPVAAGRDALRWLADRQRPQRPVDVLIQRTHARLLDPHTPAVRNVGWITVPTLECDTETALRAGAMDAVWVGSRRQRDALVAAGVPGSRVHVVTEPVDLAVVRPDAPSALPCPPRGTVFVAVDDGTWNGGWDLLVTAWATAFTARDDVALVVLLDAEDPASDAARAGRDAARLLSDLGVVPEDIADLVLVPDPLDTAGVAGVLAAADAVVLHGRADGYGRLAALAAAAGCAVIGPDEPGSADGGHRITVPWQAVPARDAATAAEGLHVRALRLDDLVDALRGMHAGRGARAPRVRPAHAIAHDRNAVMEVALARLRGRDPRPRRCGGTHAPRVVLEGDLLGVTSLAGVNRALITALAARGDVAVGAVERDAHRVEPLAAGSAVADAMSLTPGVADVAVRHFHPPSFAGSDHRRLVQVVHWEYGALPVEWRDGLAGCDEVWVASQAIRAAVSGPRGLDPARVHVVPLGVDHAAWAGAPPMDLGDVAPGFRFLFVGGLAWRKGADLLLEAYARAFTRRDDVTLVLKDFGAGGRYGADAIGDRADAMATDPHGPRVVRLSDSLPADAMPGLYAACDCLVHPFRAEAFGLTMLEAAAAGLPVIASGHGPVREFLDPGCADLLPAHGVPYPGGHIGPYTLSEPATVWEPAVEDIARAMRDRVADPAGGRAMGARAARHVADRTWDAAAAVIAERVHALTGPRRARVAA